MAHCSASLRTQERGGRNFGVQKARGGAPACSDWSLGEFLGMKCWGAGAVRLSIGEVKVCQVVGSFAGLKTGMGGGFGLQRRSSFS